MRAGGLSELSQQIEHFRRDILVDDALVGGAERVAEWAFGPSLLFLLWHIEVG